MFGAFAVCLLGVVAAVSCADTAADKPPNSDATKANGKMVLNEIYATGLLCTST